jgi:dTDP-4-amino-4,6-dideoxygalactose transaminase
LIPVSELFLSRKNTLREALALLNRTAIGVLLLVGEDGAFERTITDGDLRRLLLAGHELTTELSVLPALKSVVIKSGYSRKAALDLMNRNSINHLPVVDSNGQVIELLDRREIDQQIFLSSPHMGSAEREFVDEAFRSNWIAPLGPNVDAFESELAALVGIRHAAALSSGTAAIHLALRILGVGSGDSVFCSALTFAASANPIVYQNAEPVFIDCEPDSWNMSPSALEVALAWAKKEGRLPKAVIVVNLYGQSADIDPLMALCRQYGVPMVEDAAESLGARYKGRPSGTFGAIGIYSFNGNKIITTSGGGMLVSDNEHYVKRARHLSTQAREPALHYEHTEIGYNYRMSNILAGVGRGQLRVLQDRVETRRAVFQRYRDELSGIGAIEWMPEPSWSYSTHWLTACTLKPARRATSSTTVIRQLASEMIEARPLWKPMQMQPVFRSCRYFPHGNRSVSEDLFLRGLCLPSGSNMSDDDMSRIIDKLRECLREGVNAV